MRDSRDRNDENDDFFLRPLLSLWILFLIFDPLMASDSVHSVVFRFGCSMW
jgi:hypothetical protein